MSVKCRVGVTLSEMDVTGFGSFALPEEVNLYCPQCGTLACDRGSCKVSIIPFLEDVGGFRLDVDCRVCSCIGQEPSGKPKE